MATTVTISSRIRRPSYKQQEAALCAALINELRDTSLVVSGYSGRDELLMNALKEAYGQPGNGLLYWCGFGDSDPPAHLLDAY